MGCFRGLRRLQTCLQHSQWAAQFMTRSCYKFPLFLHCLGGWAQRAIHHPMGEKCQYQGPRSPQGCIYCQAMIQRRSCKGPISRIMYRRTALDVCSLGNSIAVQV